MPLKWRDGAAHVARWWRLAGEGGMGRGVSSNGDS
ncbi:hypothetical protein F383_34807 [Gossypium arboreum]|uniref:Uncharacterized protein n=1 Tax=Gossypium arboreum TaxID=29729 RepID=A0A0B0N7R0_GOSAR|nr:hypothetical protein F383_34807 [Gossypium arboreum]